MVMGSSTPMGGGYASVDDLGRVAEALISYRLLSREMTRRVLSGVIEADYGGRDGYALATRLVNGFSRISAPAEAACPICFSWI
jgi:hypothetical protein